MSLFLHETSNGYTSRISGSLDLGQTSSVAYRRVPKLDTDFYDSLSFVSESGEEAEILFEGYFFLGNAGVSAAKTLFEVACAVRIGNLEPLKSLNGIYNCAVIFDGGRDLVVFNDRYGLLPFYESESSRAAKIFSTRLSDFISSSVAEVDRQSVCQFLNYEFCLDGRTLLKDVARLPGGTVLYFQSSNERLRDCYFKFDKVSEATETADALCGRLHEQLEAIIGRISTVPSDIAVTLSGGLDSRTIAAYLAQKKRSFYALNVAVGRNSRERNYSKQLARLSASPWFSIRFRDLPLRKSIETNWRRLACSFSYNQCWTTPLVWDFSSRMDDFIVLDGLCLDVQLGETFSSAAPTSLDQLSHILHATFGGLTNGEIERFLHPSLKSECRSVKDAALSQALQNRYQRNGDLWSVSRSFTFENRIRNYTVGLPVSNSFLATTFFPFYDYSFFELCRSVPKALLSDRALHRHLLKKYCSAFSNIPWTKTGLPPSSDRLPSKIFPALEDWCWRLAGKLGVVPADTLEGYLVHNSDLMSFVSDLVEDSASKYQVLSQSGAAEVRRDLKKGFNVRRALSFAQIGYLFNMVSSGRTSGLSQQ